MDTFMQLLDRNLDHPPEFRAALSNHLPMALHALRELGADDQRLRSFFAHYAARFEGLPPAREAEPLTDWRSGLGRIEDFDRLRAGFAAMLASEGVEAALRRVLPDLWPGAAAAAFHGLIRTAHAVQSGHQGEIAAGLAYWAARWQSVPQGSSDSPPMAFADWSARLEATAARMRRGGGLISAGIEAVSSSGEYAGLASALLIEPTVLVQLSDWAASLYARSGNFTVLHVVTGLRAARVLWPWVDEPAAVAPGLVRAVTAAVLASNLQLRDDLPALRDWDDLRAAAIASDDDHVIKLVHACVEGSAIHGEGERRRAAARALG